MYNQLKVSSMEKTNSKSMELLEILDAIQIYGGVASYSTESSNDGCTNINCDCTKKGCLDNCTVTFAKDCTSQKDCTVMGLSCQMTKVICV